MTTDYNLCFLKNKLASFSNATMHTMGNQALPLPNDVVSLLKVDEEGQLWFAGHQPRGWIKNYEQCFAAKFFFYQKGVDHYIEARGNAFIASHEDILKFKGEIPSGSILLRMTPSVFEYTSTSKKTGVISPFKWYCTVRNWIVKNVPVYQLHKTSVPR